jgi:transcriptional accessory protein Tex/SPT6
LRKILKERYYKKLLMSTTPTSKGSHYITIYNSFFPVKRIKEKPLATLRKEMWVLAREAERLGLIVIEFKFEWQLSSIAEKKNFEGDPIYSEMVRYYFDLSASSSNSSGENWNLLRKQALTRMLAEYFFPAFIEEVKEDLTREGEREVIEGCCQKFKSQLNKGQSLTNGEPSKILAMALEQEKLGIAVVDEIGKEHSPLSIEVRTDL